MFKLILVLILLIITSKAELPSASSEMEAFKMAIDLGLCVACAATPLAVGACTTSVAYTVFSGLLALGKIENKYDLMMLNKRGECKEFDIYEGHYVEICTKDGGRLSLSIGQVELHNCYKYVDPKSGEKGECCGITGRSPGCINTCHTEDWHVRACSDGAKDKTDLGVKDLVRIGAGRMIEPEAYMPHALVKTRKCKTDEFDLDPTNRGHRGTVSPECKQSMKIFKEDVMKTKPPSMVYFIRDNSSCSVHDSYGHPLHFNDHNCPYYRGNGGFGDSGMKLACCRIKESEECDLSWVGYDEWC